MTYTPGMLRALCLACCLIPCLPGAQAEPTTVYRTVDAQGNVTFSDQPPADGPAEVLSIDVPPPADPVVLEERLEAMRETTDRMAADRRARESQRAELAAARQPAPEPEPEPVPRTLVVPAAPLYGWPGYRPPWRPRPPVRPHPVHPPLQPGIPLENNQQLMRPIVSSRR
ncbi:DUF4124 domain-containing protein [Pseudohaliea sp.]|uniref:DUF4124 domain-containing protein n=1 Tax=Pseudohaliea sp. TaxID=2740289 RepID=UPI0032EDBFC8